MWNKFFWIWKIRMGYCHVLVLYVCVVLFIFDRDKLDVWPSEWHETLESLVRHLPRMVTDIIFMAPCIRGLVIITILVSYNKNIYKIQMWCLPWSYRWGPRSVPAGVCRSPPAAASWADLTWGSWHRSPWPAGSRPCCAWCPWPARDTWDW